MVFRQLRDRHRLASVLVSAAAAAAAAIAAITAAAIAITAAAATATAITAATFALAAAAVTVAAAVAAGDLLCHRLRPLHRRSARPELHSLAQLSVGLQQQPGVLHHADAACHWKAPVSGLRLSVVDQPLLYAAWLRHSPHV